MKRILLLFLGIIAQGAFAQSAGFNNTFVILSIGGSQNLYYDLNGNTANYDFNGQTLGTFCQGSQELILKGGEKQHLEMRRLRFDGAQASTTGYTLQEALAGRLPT